MSSEGNGRKIPLAALAGAGVSLLALLAIRRKLLAKRKAKKKAPPEVDQVKRGPVCDAATAKLFHGVRVLEVATHVAAPSKSSVYRLKCILRAGAHRYVYAIFVNLPLPYIHSMPCKLMFTSIAVSRIMADLGAEVIVSFWYTLHIFTVYKLSITCAYIIYNNVIYIYVYK